MSLFWAWFLIYTKDWTRLGTLIPGTQGLLFPEKKLREEATKGRQHSASGWTDLVREAGMRMGFWGNSGDTWTSCGFLSPLRKRRAVFLH